MNSRKQLTIHWLAMASGLIAVLGIGTAYQSGEALLWVVGGVAALATVLLMIKSFRLGRCDACGRHTDLRAGGKFCKHCGKPFD